MHGCIHRLCQQASLATAQPLVAAGQLAQYTWACRWSWFQATPPLLRLPCLLLPLMVGRGQGNQMCSLRPRLLLPQPCLPHR